MALVGKYTKYETVDTGETEIQTIEYPSKLPEGHPHSDKAGTIEEVEVPIMENIETVFENVYVTVNSVTTFKFSTSEGPITLANINYRVYESKEARMNDLNDIIDEEHLLSQTIDYSSSVNEIQQAYEMVKNVQGCEELIND